MHFSTNSCFPEVNVEIVCHFPCFMYFKGEEADTVQEEYIQKLMRLTNNKHCKNIFLLVKMASLLKQFL